MHFLFWTKESHQSPNFGTSKCSSGNFLNSLYHFSNRKASFLQTLHDTSVSWKIAPLYFLSQTLYTLHKREQSNCKLLRLLSAQIKIHQILLILETNFFFNFWITFLSKSYDRIAKKVWKIYLSWHLRVMQSLIKNWLVVSSMSSRIWWNFTQPLKSLKVWLWGVPFFQS